MRWTLLTLAMLLPLSAWGQSDADCTAIEDRARQIDCYSDLGDWTFESHRLSFDDPVSIFMSVFSDDFVRLRSGGAKAAVITIGCVDSVLSIYVDILGVRFEGSHRRELKYRVNRRRAGTWYAMPGAGSNEGLGLWRSHRSIPAISELFGGDVLQIRLPRSPLFRENRAKIRFNIAGLEEQIVPLREACNW